MVKLAWQDKKRGGWDACYKDFYLGCHNPTPPVWIGSSEQDKYPDIALNPSYDYGHPVIKYQHWYAGEWRWIIENVDWNPGQHIWAIMENQATRVIETYDMYRQYPYSESPPHIYSWTILLPNLNYSYYVETEDTFGVVRTSDTLYLSLPWLGKNRCSGDELGIMAKGGVIGIPKDFLLDQNYPNPFNPITEIKYTLPMNCQVKLTIYNLLGQKVATLIDKKQTAGYKTVRWDSRSQAGNEASSGVYFYRLQAGDFVETKRMVLLK